MYNRNQLLRAFKSLAHADDSQADQGHCQRLHYHAQRLGFQNFEHYRRWLKTAPETSLANISTRLMERVCATRMPSLDEPYVEFTPVLDGISYYSCWIGWDSNGDDVRGPRPLDAKRSVPLMRKKNEHPVYVVESPRELLAWQYRWKAMAYLPEALARAFFPSFFGKGLVDPNVSPELVSQRALERHARLMVSLDAARRENA